MGKRRNVDIVATTMTRHQHKALPSDDDAAPDRMPEDAMIRCIGCKERVPAAKAALIERGRWACRPCITKRIHDDQR